MFLLDVAQDQLDDFLVEVVAAEEVVPVDLHHVVILLDHGEDADVERPSAEVEHQQEAAVLGGRFPAEGEGGGRGLGQQRLDDQTGFAAGLPGGGPLRLAEVRGHGDHGVGHRFAQGRFAVPLDLVEHHRRDVFRQVLFASHHDRGQARHGLLGLLDLVVDQLDHPLDVLVAERAPDDPLDRVDRVFGEQPGLVDGRSPDVEGGLLVVVVELLAADDRGRQLLIVRVQQHARHLAVEPARRAVGGAQIDSDCFGHGRSPYGRMIEWTLSCELPCAPDVDSP